MEYIVVFSVLVVCVMGESPYVSVQSCTEDGDIPIPVGFQSFGCIEAPCPIYRGTTSDGNITFLIPEDTNGVTIDIKAKVSGIWVPFSPSDKNVCHGLVNSYCPLDKNEIVIYKLAIPVLLIYPPISMTLKVKMLDENKTVISCLKVDCKVVDKP